MADTTILRQAFRTALCRTATRSQLGTAAIAISEFGLNQTRSNQIILNESRNAKIMSSGRNVNFTLWRCFIVP